MTQPTIVQSNFATNGTAHNNNVAPSLTGVTSGNYLLGIIGFQPSSDNNGITFNVPSDSAGQTWPAALVSKSSLNSPIATGAQAFGLASANSGTHTLTFDNSSNSAYAFAGLIEIANVSSVDQAVGAQTADHSSTSVTVTTAALANASELAIAFMTCFDSIGSTANMGITDPPTGFTSLQVYQDEATNQPGEVCNQALSSASALSVQWSWTNSGSATGIVLTFNGGGVAPPPMPIASRGIFVGS